MKIRIFLVLFLYCQLCLLNAQSISVNEITTGYKNGTLIAIGGGALDTAIFMEFRKYAGGDDAIIVVIPTALDDDSFKDDSALF